jgi:hypothetical protein
MTGLTATFVACSRGSDQAKLKADFDHICTAQKDFLSALKLKGVDEAELLVERMRRMKEGLSSEAAIQVADQLSQISDPAMRDIAEKSASEAGLKGWSCPELSAKR